MATIKIEDVKKQVSVLNTDEQQVLIDTILHGCWGDGDYEFLVNDKNDCRLIETAPMMGYCTNDAQKGGHYKGRVLSAMFRSIYRKMCPAERNKVGYVLSHANDWWGDGTGDMLFIRHEWHLAFEQWAKGGEK